MMIEDDRGSSIEVVVTPTRSDSETAGGPASATEPELPSQAPNLIRRLLQLRTDNTWIQLFRYTFVGGFAYIVDFGALFLLTEYAGIHYLVSAAIAFLFGLAVNYLLSILWVFHRRVLSDRRMEFGLYALIGVVGLALNELFIWFFTEILAFHYLISKVLSTGFVYLWNFFARKWLLFR